MGLMFQPLTRYRTLSVPKEKMGQASGLIKLCYGRSGGSFGVAVLSTLLTTRGKINNPKFTVIRGKALDPEISPAFKA